VSASPPPGLTRVTGRLYALSSAGEAAAPLWAGYRCGAGAAFGETATLQQAWEDGGGTWLLLAAAPADAAAFAQALEQALARISPGGQVRLLWLRDPNAPPERWELWPLLAQASGSGPATAWQVARGALLTLGEYAVTVPRGAAITQADPDRLGWGMAFGALSFAAPGGEWEATGGSAWLPLAGPTAGCLRAALALAAGGGDGLAALRTQLCFGAPQHDGGEGDGVDLLGMSVVAQPAGAALTLRLAFDPLHPLDAARTRLGFFDDDGGGSAPPPLPATLRSSRGYATTLAPQAAGAPLRPARLAFGRTPLTVGDPAAFGYHLTPDGAFALAVVTPSGVTVDHHRILLGRSGQEYAALDADGGALVLFEAGRPALAPGAAPQAPPSRAGAALLDGAATTAHLTVLPPRSGAAGLRYFAQPVQAPLYADLASSLPAGFLDYAELPAATLPAWSTGEAAPPPTVAGAPLAGVAPADAALAARVEAVLAPARRLALGIVPGAAAIGAAEEVTVPAVTPQGLRVGIADGQVRRVVLATMPATPQRELALTAVGPRLRAALGSAELFAVVADPDALMDDSSIPYRLDETGLALAAARGVPPATIARLRPVVMPGGSPRLFDDEQAFSDAVGAVAPEHVTLLRELGGFLEAVMSDWVVQLSPRAWRRPAPERHGAVGAPTVMLLKFAHRSLERLVDDAAAWPWPEAAALPGADVAATQAELLRIVAQARARADAADVPDDDPYARFYRDVVADPGWNGVLFLNAPVDAGRLPAALQFVTAGVDPERFYAHHVGFSATPVALEPGGAIATGQTAAFGLVDYDDPVDQTLPEGAPVPFAFKTLRLTARFANAALEGFSARVELLVNELLGARLEKLDPTHGNNLVLGGSLQQAGDSAPLYAFALEGVNRYGTRGTLLDTLDVTGVGVQTRDGVAGSGETTVRFTLAGELRFDEPRAFDAISYGPVAPQAPLLDGDGDGPPDGWLTFDGLAIDMSFPLGGPGDAAPQRFAVDHAGVRLDAGASRARPNALVSRFPVTLAGFVAAGARETPEQLGYVSVSAPGLDQQPLEGGWFGIAYALDLGTLGALSGGASLTLGLLAAWGPAQRAEEQPVYLGLQLPGYANGSFAWPLQGVMRLGFRSFGFEAAEDEHGVRSYALRLRRLALSVLGLSCPPGSTDLVLFGGGDAASARAVGWYAAYAADPPSRGADAARELAR
jgi:hypothetical protein